MLQLIILVHSVKLLLSNVMIHFVDLILLFGMIRLMRVIQVPNFESLASSVTINPCGSFY